MTVSIFGATGLIGGHLLQYCLQHPDIQQVRVFLRKPLPLEHPKLQQHLCTLDTLDAVASHIQGGVVFNCLGTTIRQAGSEAAQYAIDCSYPSRVAQLAAANGVPCSVNVSSVGASATGNFYLKTKHDMETAVQSAIPRSYFMRPSLLLGKRTEFRLGERIAMALMPLFDLLLFGSLRKYHSITAETVAKAMLQVALKQPDSGNILHYDDIRQMAGQ